MALFYCGGPVCSAVDLSVSVLVFCDWLWWVWVCCLLYWVRLKKPVRARLYSSWSGCVLMGLVYWDGSGRTVMGLLPYPVDAPVLAASLPTSHWHKENCSLLRICTHFYFDPVKIFYSNQIRNHIWIQAVKGRGKVMLKYVAREGTWTSWNINCL